MVSKVRVRGVLGLVCWALALPAHAQSVVTTMTSSPPAAPVVAADMRVDGPGPIRAAAARAATQAAPLANPNLLHRPQGRRGCPQKIWWGLGIGAGVGFALGLPLAGAVEEGPELTLAMTSVMALIGFGVGYKLCS